jgi:tricorn protease
MSFIHRTRDQGILQHRPAFQVIGVVAMYVLPLLAAADQSSKYLLFRKPTASKTQIAFSYGGDLWIVDRNGGEARRLTADIGIETNPAFSPDGSWIAFTGEYDGNEDVYVIPAEGGMPRRLTAHPGSDQVVGWTRNGKRVLFRSGRNSYSRFNRLFTVGVEGGLPEELPLPMAEEGSYSPDSARLAYVPYTNFKESGRTRGLKHYRGGTASPIWIANLADSIVEKVPRKDSNDSTPMWLGDRVYFLSDRDGAVSLYFYDTRTKQVAEAFAGDGQDINSASAGSDVIVFEKLGSIHLFDVTTGKEHVVDIRLSGDFPAARPHFIKAAEQIENANISPTGVRAVFEAHGEILTVPAEHGDIRNLTNSPSVADRDPAWSPDGKMIAYFSDESGEYALHLRSQEGMGETRKIDLGKPGSFFYEPRFSPDSKKIVFMDKRLNLWYVDLTNDKPVLLDTNPYDETGQYDVASFETAWSPDSRWIAYTRQLPSHMHAVFVYSIETREQHQVTDGMSDAAFPSFDRNGRYLYFTASTDIGPVIASSMGAFRMPVTRSGYVVVLRKDLKSPLAPQSDEETDNPANKTKAPPDECTTQEQAGKDDFAKADDAKKSDEKSKDKKEKQDKETEAKKNEPEPVRIDFADISQRILALPFPARNYSGMIPGRSHVVYLLESPAADDASGTHPQILHKFDICTRKTDKLLDNINNFNLSANAEKALYQRLPEPDPMAPPDIQGAAPKGQWFIKSVEALGKPPDAAVTGKSDGALKLDAMEVYVDPRAEWKQMYHETWRIERDFFYDPKLHGADAKALEAAYQPYVDHLVSRPDLTYLMADMLGEITAQHVYLGGGDRPEVKHVSGGLLGADYRIENGHYRFWRIYQGENWNPSLRAPLTEPGVNVHEGEYLLAVNGRELKGSDEIFSLFQETAGKAVILKVGPDASGEGARDVTVVPIADEHSLRQHAWMDANRRKVDQLSGGKLAYVYLPDTFVNGYTNFNRYYFPQSDKQGAVIDERFNGGGWVADYIVDWLKRPLLAAAMTREGSDAPLPVSIYGPKVMLINEYAGSGGDALPWMFRRMGGGPLIGTRTWGGLIGIGGYPRLMDGGSVTAPRFAIYNPEKSEFDVENQGVAPDIDVEFDPHSWREGRDPQLEKAVAVALDELKQHPVHGLKHPPYPSYNWTTLRAEQAKKANTQTATQP